MRPVFLISCIAAITACLGAQAPKRAGQDWWSLQPIRAVTPPKIEGDTWSRNGIDGFVLQRLRDNKLQPSDQATPRTLVRRLYFDLLGLPPDPNTVEVFRRNPSDAAYLRLVDELLDSPHYGERWAQHWLDVARFGESDGFERNSPRKNAWHYRDWVIEALNADMPHDRFARLQIAGDIEQPGKQGSAAVGFLVAGLHNTVVGSSQRMKLLARQDELAEIAGAVSQAFLGLTVHCARCHDHKFDPISSREYYSFIAALDGVQHGERTVASTEVQHELTAAQTALVRLEERLEAIDEPVRTRILALREAETDRQQHDLPRPVAAWEFEGDLRDSIGELHGRVIGSARLENGALVLDGKGHVLTQPLSEDLGEKTLEAWVMLDDLEQQGGGVIGVQTTGGGTFDSIVYGERVKREWLVGSNSFQRTKRVGGPVEATAHKQPVHMAIVYQADGTITTYRNGKRYGTPYKTRLQSFSKAKSEVVFGMRHSPAGGNRMLRGRILRAGLHERALSPDAVRACAGAESRHVSEDSIVKSLDKPKGLQREQLVKEISQAQQRVTQLTAASKIKIFTVNPRKPGVMRIHDRGGVTSFGDAVAPAGITALKGVDGDFRLAEDSSDADRRRALAAWVSSRNNPLFARVITNRIWHHHFGSGIVDTPSDLGFNGGRPTHAHLLDWLANQLREADYRIKAMHRLIVTSATYRQSSRPNPTSMKADARNRLLWRYSPRRIDAEALRDTMLVVADRLNRKRGGPGFVDVSITPNSGTTYYAPIDPPGPAFERRTIYRFAPRGGRSTLLDTFDCPDPSAATPKRSVTTTPLQALSLLNNSFVLRMAQALAERIVKDVGADHDAQVKRAYQLTLLRQPDQRETHLARKLIDSHNLRALTRALFNSSEFVVIE